MYLALVPGPCKPRDLVSHLDIRDDICTNEGLNMILSMLDKEYVPESYVKVDEAQARYERSRRMPG